MADPPKTCFLFRSDTSASEDSDESEIQGLANIEGEFENSQPFTISTEKKKPSYWRPTLSSMMRRQANSEGKSPKQHSMRAPLKYARRNLSQAEATETQVHKQAMDKAIADVNLHHLSQDEASMEMDKHATAFAKARTRNREIQKRIDFLESRSKTVLQDLSKAHASGNDTESLAKYLVGVYSKIRALTQAKVSTMTELHVSMKAHTDALDQVQFHVKAKVKAFARAHTHAHALAKAKTQEFFANRPGGSPNGFPFAKIYSRAVALLVARVWSQAHVRKVAKEQAKMRARLKKMASVVESTVLRLSKVDAISVQASSALATYEHTQAMDKLIVEFSKLSLGSDEDPQGPAVDSGAQGNAHKNNVSTVSAAKTQLEKKSSKGKSSASVKEKKRNGKPKKSYNEPTTHVDEGSRTMADLGKNHNRDKPIQDEKCTAKEAPSHSNDDSKICAENLTVDTSHDISNGKSSPQTTPSTTTTAEEHLDEAIRSEIPLRTNNKDKCSSHKDDPPSKPTGEEPSEVQQTPALDQRQTSVEGKKGQQSAEDDNKQNSAEVRKPPIVSDGNPSKLETNSHPPKTKSEQEIKGAGQNIENRKFEEPQPSAEGKMSKSDEHASTSKTGLATNQEAHPKKQPKATDPENLPGVKNQSLDKRPVKRLKKHEKTQQLQTRKARDRTPPNTSRGIFSSAPQQQSPPSISETEWPCLPSMSVSKPSSNLEPPTFDLFRDAVVSTFQRKEKEPTLTVLHKGTVKCQAAIGPKNKKTSTTKSTPGTASTKSAGYFSGLADEDSIMAQVVEFVRTIPPEGISRKALLDAIVTMMPVTAFGNVRKTEQLFNGAMELLTSGVHTKSLLTKQPWLKALENPVSRPKVPWENVDQALSSLVETLPLEGKPAVVFLLQCRAELQRPLLKLGKLVSILSEKVAVEKSHSWISLVKKKKKKKSKKNAEKSLCSQELFDKIVEEKPPTSTPTLTTTCETYTSQVATQLEDNSSTDKKTTSIPGRELERILKQVRDSGALLSSFMLLCQEKATDDCLAFENVNEQSQGILDIRQKEDQKLVYLFKPCSKGHSVKRKNRIPSMTDADGHDASEEAPKRSFLDFLSKLAEIPPETFLPDTTLWMYADQQPFFVDTNGKMHALGAKVYSRSGLQELMETVKVRKFSSPKDTSSRFSYRIKLETIRERAECISIHIGERPPTTVDMVIRLLHSGENDGLRSCLICTKKKKTFRVNFLRDLVSTLGQMARELPGEGSILAILTTVTFYLDGSTCQAIVKPVSCLEDRCKILQQVAEETIAPKVLILDAPPVVGDRSSVKAMAEKGCTVLVVPSCSTILKLRGDKDLEALFSGSHSLLQDALMLESPTLLVSFKDLAANIFDITVHHSEPLAKTVIILD